MSKLIKQFLTTKTSREFRFQLLLVLMLALIVGIGIVGISYYRERDVSVKQELETYVGQPDQPVVYWEGEGVTAAIFDSTQNQHTLISKDKYWNLQDNTTWVSSGKFVDIPGAWSNPPLVDGLRYWEGEGVTAAIFDATQNQLTLISKDKYWNLRDNSIWVSSGKFADIGGAWSNPPLVPPVGGQRYWEGEGVTAAFFDATQNQLTLISRDKYWNLRDNTTWVSSGKFADIPGAWSNPPLVDGQRYWEGEGVTAVIFDATQNQLTLISRDKYWNLRDNSEWVSSGKFVDIGGAWSNPPLVGDDSCTPGIKKCGGSANNIAQTCVANGTYWGEEQCLTNESCESGKCNLNLSYPNQLPANIDKNKPIYIYDIRELSSANTYDQQREYYDKLLSLASIQAQVNKYQPNLFFLYTTEKQVVSAPPYNFTDFDNYWFEIACKEVSGKCTRGHIKDRTVIRKSVSQSSALQIIKDYQTEVDGMVVWDERVPATSNVAASVAGAEDALVLRYDTDSNSLFQQVKQQTSLPILVDLYHKNFTDTSNIPDISMPTSNSSKNNAYLWFIENYIKANKTDPTYAAYSVDAAEYMPGIALPTWITDVVNYDYLMAHQSTIFDLSPFSNEAPNDDSTQPVGTDRATLEQMLTNLRSKAGSKIIKIHGFIPWPYKYTKAAGHSQINEAYDGERYSTNLFASYNASLAEGDAPALGSMPNGSFYQHLRRNWMPLNSHNTSPDPNKQIDPNMKYILWQMGDYDSSAWFYSMAPVVWEDPKLGEYPLAWMIGPSLFDRFPLMFDYITQKATANDYFMAMESGVGYLNPNLSPNLEPYVNESYRLYQRQGISSTGLMIVFDDEGAGNANAWPKSDQVKSAIRQFSPGGVMIQNSSSNSIRKELYRNMTMNHTTTTAIDAFRTSSHAGEMANKIRQAAQQGIQFISIRSIVSMPSFVSATMQQLDGSYEAVDPFTFNNLMRKKLSGQNTYKASYLSSDMPVDVNPGDAMTVNLRVRNDGENSWDSANVKASWAIKSQPFTPAQPGGASPDVNLFTSRASFTKPVIYSGESGVISFQLIAPANPGVYYLQVDLVHEGVTWFESQGSLPWQTSFGVFVPRDCNPGDTESASCIIANGTGQKTRNCNNDGRWESYSSCALQSCNTGYHPEGNVCIANTCSGSATRNCQAQDYYGLENRTCDTSTHPGTWSAWDTSSCQLCSTSNVCQEAQVVNNTCEISNLADGPQADCNTGYQCVSGSCEEKPAPVCAFNYVEDDNNRVDVMDLLFVLNNWGDPDPYRNNEPINVMSLLGVLSGWGEC